MPRNYRGVGAISIRKAERMNKRMSLWLSGLVLLTGLLGELALAQTDAESETTTAPPVKLEWRLVEGQTYESRLVQTSEVTSQVEERKRTVNNELELILDWSVISANETEFKIMQTISALRVVTKSETTGKLLELDTRKPEAAATRLEKDLMKQILPLIGAEFLVTMSRRGEILDVEVPETSLKELRKVPGSLQLRSLLTPEGIKDFYGQSIIILPDEAVSDGFEWKTTEQLKTQMGELGRTNQYVVKAGSPAETQKVIGLDVAVAQAKTTEESKSKMISFSGSGEFVFDFEKGCFSSTEFSNEMRTERPYRNHTILTSVKTTIKMSFRLLAEDRDAR